MVKYNIEGGIKFYEELYKMLDENDSKNEDVCLISNEPLSENYVKLLCGHKFNYLPLFNDIMNHKKKFNSLETHHLKQGQIRCPYCRNKQNKLLPYYENMGVNKVIGVNILPEPLPGFIFGTCLYYEDEQQKYCSDQVMLLELNNKTYCSCHYSVMKYKIERYELRKKKLEDKKKEKEEAKIKAKEEAKKLKDEAKEEAKKLKDEAKEQAKKLKDEAKEKVENSEKDKTKKVNTVKKSTKIISQNISNNNANNTVVSNENELLNNTLCSEIVKSGKNKGQQCKCKVYLSTKCKRHYALLVIKENNTKLENIGPLEIKTPSHSSP
jgi:flagellar biosynthesis GTPase FlhF